MNYKICEETLTNGNTIVYKVHPIGTAFRKSMRMVDGTVDARETSDEVCELLVHLWQCEATVRVFYGSEDGRASVAEWDVAGHIGRSMGSIRIPLLVPPKADGGSGLLDHCIVRLDTQRRGKIVTLWQHPNFHLPELRLSVTELPLELPYLVERNNGSAEARFHTETERTRWLDLVTGTRFPDEQDFELWRS